MPPVNMEPREKAPPRRRPRGAARAALLEAARAEFNEAGYEATDSNRIARRAGYAPQSFYWHFSGKAEIFAEVFKGFVAAEYAAMQAAIAAGPESITAAVIEQHTNSRLFRRSLRHLSVTDPHIRAIRLETRRRQVASLVDTIPGFTPDDAVAVLLAIDRLADAAAEGELAELGVTDAAGMLTTLWRRLTPSPDAGLHVLFLERIAAENEAEAGGLHEEKEK